MAKLIGVLLLLVAMALAVSGKEARAEEASGAVLANTCFSCHGTDGKSAGKMPSIAGKEAEYIINEMTKFKARFKKRKNPPTVMNRIAKGFSDSEIRALAKFFSKK